MATTTRARNSVKSATTKAKSAATPRSGAVTVVRASKGSPTVANNTKGNWNVTTESMEHSISPNSASILSAYGKPFRPGNVEVLIDELRKGFAISVFERTSRAIDIPIVALARITNIPARTWARRKREGRLEQIESERLLRIIRLFEQATVVLGNVDQARNWIKSPKKAFRGKTPLEYADTEVGAREVEDLLGRLDHGVFS